MDTKSFGSVMVNNNAAVDVFIQHFDSGDTIRTKAKHLQGGKEKSVFYSVKGFAKKSRNRIMASESVDSA